MKTPVFLLLILLLSLNINCLSQKRNEQISILISSEYSILGDGDYRGFYYNNGLRFNIFKHIQISESIGFCLSTNNGRKNILQTHNFVNISNDIFVSLLAIDNEKFKVGFDLGGSVRYRSEVYTTGYTEINGVKLLKYNNLDSFELGYLGQLEVGFIISQKTSLFLLASIHSYRKGSGISSFGFGVSLKL
jgi:sRNA-binding carbon storage regulator CsrA